MKLLDGLFVYEIVLLMLGTLFFLVLLFVLLYSVITRREIKHFILLFPIPIVMIGFPAIQKIKIDKGVIEIEKLAEKVDRNPTDQTMRRDLVKKLAEVEERPISSPSALLAVAKAQASIGQEKKALERVDSVLMRKPDSLEARKLKERLTR